MLINSFTSGSLGPIVISLEAGAVAFVFSAAVGGLLFATTPRPPRQPPSTHRSAAATSTFWRCNFAPQAELRQGSRQHVSSVRLGRGWTNGKPRWPVPGTGGANLTIDYFPRLRSFFSRKNRSKRSRGPVLLGFDSTAKPDTANCRRINQDLCLRQDLAFWSWLAVGSVVFCCFPSSNPWLRTIRVPAVFTYISYIASLSTETVGPFAISFNRQFRGNPPSICTAHSFERVAFTSSVNSREFASLFATQLHLIELFNASARGEAASFPA